MWVLGVLGLVPGADKYALLFGAWVALTELIPYLGPWLGAIPGRRSTPSSSTRSRCSG